MLKIAVPNKGSLAEPAAEILREAGYRQRRDGRDLVMTDPDNTAEFYYLRPRDIAVYVGEGTLDIGLTGRDLVLDSRGPGGGAAHPEVRRVAVLLRRTDRRFAKVEVDGHRVATSYAGIVEDFLTPSR